MAATLEREEWRAFSDFMALAASGLLSLIGLILALAGKDPVMKFHGCLLLGAAGLVEKHRNEQRLLLADGDENPSVRLDLVQAPGDQPAIVRGVAQAKAERGRTMILADNLNRRVDVGSAFENVLHQHGVQLSSVARLGIANIEQRRRADRQTAGVNPVQPTQLAGDAERHVRNSV